MLRTKLALTVLSVLSVAFVLSGCPKGDKMMGGTSSPQAVVQTLR